MKERKIVSKKKWKRIVWSTLIGGVILTSVGSYTNFQALRDFGILITGLGAGLAWSRSYKIEGYD